MVKPNADEANDGRSDRWVPARGYAGNAYVRGLVLTEDEVCVFLIRSADEYDAELCEDNPCEVCDAFCHTWHDIYAQLTARYRLSVEEALSALAIPSPRPRHGGL